MESYDESQKNKKASGANTAIKKILHVLNTSSLEDQKSLCNYCFVNLGTNAQKKKHMSTYHPADLHSLPSSSVKNPYMILQDRSCPLGCTYKSLELKSLLMHIIIYHSHSQLQTW